MSIKKHDETISVRRRQRSSLRRQPRLSAGGMTDGASRYEEHDKKPRDHGLSFSEDFLALDQHVRLDEVAHLRVHRHHGTAANDIAPAQFACALGQVSIVRNGRARGKQTETCSSGTGRRHTFEKITSRSEMVVRISLIRQFIYIGVSPFTSH